MIDWPSIIIGVLGGAAAVGSAWAVDKTKWMRRGQPTIRRTDLTQTAIEPERDGQQITRGPSVAVERQRKEFSKKRRGGTAAHMSQPRRDW